MSARREDWPARLAALVEARRAAPFAWGVHDCCQFARTAVIAVRGTDPVAAIKLGRYKTAAGARRQLLRLGGVLALPERCGLVPVPLSQAQRGDLVVGTGLDGGDALGVCLGERAAFPGLHGLVFPFLHSCRAAWRV